MISAEKELRRARFLGWEESEVTPLLARVYLALGKNEDLLALGLDALPTGQSDPMSGEERLTDSADTDEVMLNRARLYASENDLIRARAQAEAVIERNPTSSAALIVLGDIELQEGSLDGAEEAYSRAVEHAINPTQALLQRALVRIEKLDFNQAQLDVDKLMERMPRNTGVHYMQGVIHYHQQDYTEAVASLQIAEIDRARYPRALLYSGISHHALGNYDQAITYATQFSAIEPKDVAGQRLLATIAMTSGNFESAEKIMRPLVSARPDDWASMNLLANALMAQGKAEEGIVLLSIVAELQPDSSIAQARLGAGNLMGGDQSAGIKQLESALAMNPELGQAEALLAMNYVREGNFERALAAAEDYLRRRPGKVDALTLLGGVYLAAGQTEESREVYKDALNVEPGDPGANHGLAQIAISEGNYDAAKRYYDAVLAEHENHLPTLLKLAEMTAMQANQAAMVAYLQQAMKYHPYQMFPRVLMGRYYLSISKPAEVLPLFSELSDEQQSQPLVLHVVALAEIALKDYSAAKSSLEKLVAINPRAAQVHHLQALVYAALNENPKMEQALIKALQLSPTYVAPRVMLARLYLAQGNSGLARPHMEVLRDIAASSPDMLGLEAAFARLEGDGKTALAFAERAYEESASSRSLLELTRNLRQQAQSERAEELTAQWLRNNPEDTRVRLAQANANALSRDSSTAIRQYQELIAQDPDNVKALNNLAWFLKESDARLALVYAERAAELAPGSVATLDTLAMVLLSNDDLARARKTIDKALRANPGNPSVRYHSALISSRAGDNEAALALLGPLVVSKETFPFKEEARALFLKLQ
jgi:putative PEP-CTERM system TPR-repeat lipoprotein